MIIQFIAYCQWLLSRPTVMGKLLNGNMGVSIDWLNQPSPDSCLGGPDMFDERDRRHRSGR